MEQDVGTRETEQHRVAAQVEDSGARISQSAIGMVRGERVTVGQAAVGAVIAQGDVDLSQGGARTMIAGGNLRIHQGGGGMFVAGGGAEISEGGVGTMVALGGVRIERGGTILALTPRLEAHDSIIGLALTPRLEVPVGTRVIAGPREIVAAGAIAGGVVGLVLALVRLAGRR